MANKNYKKAYDKYNTQKLTARVIVYVLIIYLIYNAS